MARSPSPVKVVNPLSAAEPVEIVSLTDDVYGSLAGKGSCLPAATTLILAPGGVYTCTFTVFVGGKPNETKTDTIVGKANDDEGNIAEDSASASVLITDVIPVVVVDKTADPTSVPETGGPVFTVRVTNPASAVESIVLSELTDSPYGDLNGKGTCDLTPPVTLGIGKEYVCTFSETIKGDFPEVHKNTVTAAAADDEKNRVTASDDAEVALTDVIPTILVDKAALPTSLPEPGGNVTCAVAVTNTSLETIFLTSLVDDPFGSLAGKGDCLATIPVTIEPAKTYSCMFSAPVSGNATSTHRATVTVLDVEPTLLVAKAAAPSVLPEPGGTATFTVTVTNPAGAVEPIRLTGLVDSVYGSLNGEGNCDVPQDIDPGETYTCTFTGPVAGNGGDTHTNEVTGTAQDNDGNKVTGKDTAEVAITEVLPTIKVDKTAGATSVHSGDSVIYTYAVSNLSVEPLREVVLSDDKCSPVTGTGGDSDNDTLLDPGETWTFTCTATLSNPGQITNTCTVKGTDPIGQEVTATDTAVVSVLEIEVLPAREDQPGAVLLPAPAPTPQPTLPVTGRDLMRLAASGLAMVAGGSLLRRRRKS